MPKFTLDQFRKDLSPKFKLAPKLDKALRDFDESWTFSYEPKEHDTYWHPSSHCTPLPSDLYDMAQERLNPDPEANRDFQRKMAKFSQVGHFWHQYLQHIMVRYGICDIGSVEKEGFKPLYGDEGWAKEPGHFLACRGSADVAPWVYQGHDYIVDFKTMASRSFQKVTLPDSFAAKYECQMNIYMDFFGYERALILAINKDTPHDFKEFEFRINQPLVDAIYDKWKFVAACIDADERPDADDDQDFAELPLESV